jgi:hypothetical protein
MKNSLFIVSVVLAAILVSGGCRKGVERPPAELGEVEGEAGLPGVVVEEEEGAPPAKEEERRQLCSRSVVRRSSSPSLRIRMASSW